MQAKLVLMPGNDGAQLYSLRRQRRAELCESEASLVYRSSSRMAIATQRNPVSTHPLQTNRL